MNKIKITKEMFVPILQIYSSEYKRQIYLDTFLYYMFDETLIENFNNDEFNSGPCLDNLLTEYHFETFAYVINEHTCKIIASFISYLGTNGGYQFLSDVKKFEDLKNIPKQYAYELTWYYENMRRFAHNSGYRAIEYILNPVEFHPGPSERYFKKGYYDPTVEDYEIIEYICKWLGSTSGQLYLQKSLELISLEQEKRVENEFTRMVRKTNERLKA